MNYNSLGHWVFAVYEFNSTPWWQLLSLLRILSWIINMQLLSYSSRSSVVGTRKSISFTLTAKQIMFRIIWPILAILYLMALHF
ncbi:hypothetical protein LINGRAHAP2_LOCUS17302 [Linum grandiflorum]